MRMIKVWQLKNAPKKYQRLSTHGGDEDWIVFGLDVSVDLSGRDPLMAAGKGQR